MRLQSCFWTTLKMLLVAAFVAAGGSFSHSLAGTAHEHSHETAAASGGDIPHDHASNHSDHNAADHETVHCGAYLLALTDDEHLSIPDLIEDSVRDTVVSNVSRVWKIDPPPPRPAPLSV